MIQRRFVSSCPISFPGSLAAYFGAYFEKTRSCGTATAVHRAIQSVIKLSPLRQSHSKCLFSADRVHEQKSYLEYAAKKGDGVQNTRRQFPLCSSMLRATASMLVLVQTRSSTPDPAHRSLISCPITTPSERLDMAMFLSRAPSFAIAEIRLGSWLSTRTLSRTRTSCPL